jgi:hypothetical protein
MRPGWIQLLILLVGCLMRPALLCDGFAHCLLMVLKEAPQAAA